MSPDLEPFLPALDNAPVFFLVATLLVSAFGISIVSGWPRHGAEGISQPIRVLKRLIAIPTWLMFGGWLCLGAAMLTFVGMMGSPILLVLAPLIGTLLLTVLTVVAVAWARSRRWADWFLITAIAGSFVLLTTFQRLWICEPLAWSGLQPAQMCTAALYASGAQGATKNRTTAAHWYGEAANQGSEEAVFALLAVTPNKLTQRRFLEAAANYGNGTAMLQLFVLLGPVEGGSWLDSAIELRNPDALYQQSRFILTGEHGLEQNPAEAQALLVEAAELGSMGASAELALAYERGDRIIGYSRAESLHWERKVSKNWPGAVGFRRELARYRDIRDGVAAGDPLSLLTLAEDYQRRARQDPHYQADAELWFVEAADSGEAEAQFDMALRYFRKTGVSAAQLESARGWLSGAADQGHRYALSNVAHFLTNGQHGFAIDLDRAHGYGTALIAVLKEDDRASKQDLDRAVKKLAQIEQMRTQQHAWVDGLDALQTRAAAGEAQAKYELYEKHSQDNLRGDRTLARQLLLEAAQLGHLEARYRVASQTLQRKRTDAEAARAYAWMADAADRGHRAALVFMGRLYQRGSAAQKIEKDPERARAFFEQSLEGLEGDVIYQRKNGRMTVSMPREQVERALADLAGS